MIKSDQLCIEQEIIFLVFCEVLKRKCLLFFEGFLGFLFDDLQLQLNTIASYSCLTLLQPAVKVQS